MNSAPLLLSGGFSEAVWLLQTAEASVFRTYTQTQREHGIHLHLRASISLQRSAALRGPGLLNLRLAPPSAHDVSRRESERERGGQY